MIYLVFDMVAQDQPDQDVPRRLHGGAADSFTICPWLARKKTPTAARGQVWSPVRELLPTLEMTQDMKRIEPFGPRLHLMLIVSALLLSSCGDSDEPRGSTSDERSGATLTNEDIDACALVTTAEAAGALGVASAEADRPSEANMERRSQSYSGGEDTVIRLRTCRFTGERDRTVAVLTVMVRQSSDPIESRIGFEGMRETYAESVGVTDMPGLGEQAFWMDGFAGLHVLHGGLQLSISGDIEAGDARDLAARALERLR
jgi:hypothetical protein